MGMHFQLDLAWARTARGIRQCQKADKAWVDGNLESAGKHFNKAMNDFAVASDHLARAEDDANAKAAKLIDAGNEHLHQAIDRFADGDVEKAEKYYVKALDNYDEALDLFG